MPARWREFILCGLALLAFVPGPAPVVKGTANSDKAAPSYTAQTLLASVATPSVTPAAAPATDEATSQTTVPVAPPWSDGNAGAFAVPPGGQLPSDAQCAARVTKTKESRPANATANKTKGKANAPLSNWGVAAVPLAKRVSGNFAGTTDEIIQWASCKWGFEPDPVRAQVMIESGWRQGALGGYETNPAKCADKSLRRVVLPTATTAAAQASTTTTTTRPLPGQGAPGQIPTTAITAPQQPTTTTAPPVVYECPTAFGLLQIRSDFHPGTYPMSLKSTAYNLDYSLAMKRACYEGVSWLGAKTKGNAWGCVGVHYSGNWLDPAANSYVERVKNMLARRGWA